MVGVRLATHVPGHQRVTRNLAHRGQDAGVLDPPRHQLVLDHAPPARRTPVGDLEDGQQEQRQEGPRMSQCNDQNLARSVDSRRSRSTTWRAGPPFWRRRTHENSKFHALAGGPACRIRGAGGTRSVRPIQGAGGHLGGGPGRADGPEGAAGGHLSPDGGRDGGGGGAIRRHPARHDHGLSPGRGRPRSHPLLHGRQPAAHAGQAHGRGEGLLRVRRRDQPRPRQGRAHARGHIHLPVRERDPHRVAGARGREAQDHRSMHLERAKSAKEGKEDRR